MAVNKLNENLSYDGLQKLFKEIIMKNEIIDTRDNEFQSKVKTISIDEIMVKSGRRPINQEKVKELSESIGTIGLINPITITTNTELIAGEHRLEAVKLLGWKDIEAIILDVIGLRAELAEIDENLIRNVFDHVEMGELANRREEILEELGLRAKSGDNQFTGGENNSPPVKTTADMAKEMGVSERVLQQNKRLAKHLTPEAKEAVVKHNIPKDQAYELCREDPETQNKIVAMLDSGEVENIKKTLRILKKEEDAAKIKTFGRPEYWQLNEKLNKGKEHSCIIIYDNEKIWKYYNYVHSKTDSIIFIWIKDETIFRTEYLFNQLGFKFKQILVWDKNNSHCEFCLVGTKGNYYTTKLPEIFREDEIKEGNKPEVFYKIVEEICKDENKIEFFPNEKRDGYNVFEKPINHLSIPDGYTHIECDLYHGKNLTSVTIPDSVIHIGDDVFGDNQLTEINIPDSVTHIGKKAFYKNELTSVTLPKNITSISDGAFEDNKLTNVIIPNNVTKICKEAFSNNQLTTVKIPDSVKEIEWFAFLNNKLTSVIIPDDVLIYESSFDMKYLDENSKQSIQKAVERTKFALLKHKYGNMVCKLPIKKGVCIENFQKAVETVGLNYLLVDCIFYFDQVECDFKSEECKKVIEMVKNDDPFDRTDDTDFYGYFTKNGFIGESIFKKMKPKPKTLTVDEYRGIINP